MPRAAFPLTPLPAEMVNAFGSYSVGSRGVYRHPDRTGHLLHFLPELYSLLFFVQYLFFQAIADDVVHKAGQLLFAGEILVAAPPYVEVRLWDIDGRALAGATVVEKTVDEDIAVAFEYPFMNDVMRIVKEEQPDILAQSYDMDCYMKQRIRKSLMPQLRARLEKVESARILDEEEEEAEEMA